MSTSPTGRVRPAVRPSVYVTNLATVAATRRRGGRSGPAVGPGPVLGIMRRPPARTMSTLKGHVPALMPEAKLLARVKRGELDFETYCAELRLQWAASGLGPGVLDIAQCARWTTPPADRRGALQRWDGMLWWRVGLVESGSTLVTASPPGEACHRQLAAQLLAEAGWFVVLDGSGIDHRGGPSSPTSPSPISNSSPAAPAPTTRRH